MHKKFEVNRTKIKGGCQSERKVVTHDSKRDLPLDQSLIIKITRPAIINCQYLYDEILSYVSIQRGGKIFHGRIDSYAMTHTP